MPRPYVPINKSPREADIPCDQSVATVSDAARSFELHLHGLADMFHFMQQQHFELMQRVDTAHSFHLPRKVWTPTINSGIESGKACVTFAGHDFARHPSGDSEPMLPNMLPVEITIPETPTQNGHQVVERKQLLAQFERVDKRKTGKLEEEEITAVMNSFIDAWELEDLPSLFKYLNSRGEACTPSEVLHSLSKAHVRHTSPAGSHCHSHSSPVEALTFEGFVQLMAGETTEAEASGSVKRDMKTVREAFVAENNFYLYVEDVSDAGEDKLGAQPVRGPQGKEALFFDFVPAGVIVVNALTIGLMGELMPGHWIWQVMEFLFLFFYMFEAGAKIKLYGANWYFAGPDWKWNWFDFSCILLSLVDVTISTMVLTGTFESPINLDQLMLIKMLRMTRMARLVRTLRFAVFNELKVMVLGVISGMRCLAWAVVLLLVLVYVFGVAFTNVLGTKEPEFESLFASMFTLFRCFTEGCAAYDGTPLTERLRKRYGIGFIIPYIVLFMAISLGVFNLIMAVFIDNVMDGQLVRKLQEMSTSANRVEINIKEQLLRLVLARRANAVPQDVVDEIKSLSETLSKRTARLRAQFAVLEHSNVVISRPSFEACLTDNQFLAVLRDADIETANSASIFDILDADMSGWLSINEMYHGLMRLRGPICKSEIVGIRLRIRHLTQLVHGLADDLGQNMNSPQA